MQEKEVYYSDSTGAVIFITLAVVVVIMVILAGLGWVYYDRRMYLYDLRAPFSVEAVLVHAAIPFLIYVGKHVLGFLVEVLEEGENIFH